MADLPKPFVVHNTDVWIGESGEGHPDPAGWIDESVTPARIVTDDPAAEAHVVRELLKDTEVPEPKVGAYSPFDEWSKSAQETLQQANRLAEDIMRVLPE